jgi:hypothetical protein
METAMLNETPSTQTRKGAPTRMNILQPDIATLFRDDLSLKGPSGG